MVQVSTAPDDPADGDSAVRSEILVLGGSGAGKTVWIARLLDALQTPATILNGRIQERDPATAGAGADVLRCEFADPATEAHNRAIVGALEARRWPLTTLDPVEHLVDFVLTGETVRRFRRKTTLIELPGTALVSAFAPSNPSTLTMGWAVGNQLSRTSAVILLIDPVVAAERTQDSVDLLNATVAMLEHLRSTPHGRSIPVAIILSKCDRGYKTILKEGGVRQFTERHLQPILHAAGSARVYVSSATRSRLVAIGHREPSIRRPVENLVEPMYFLLGTLDRIDAIRRRAASVMQAEAKRRATIDREAARRRRSGELRISSRAWTAFAVGSLMLAIGAVRLAQSKAADRGDVAEAALQDEAERSRSRTSAPSGGEGAR